MKPTFVMLVRNNFNLFKLNACLLCFILLIFGGFRAKSQTINGKLYYLYVKVSDAQLLIHPLNGTPSRPKPTVDKIILQPCLDSDGKLTLRAYKVKKRYKGYGSYSIMLLAGSFVMDLPEKNISLGDLEIFRDEDTDDPGPDFRIIYDFLNDAHNADKYLVFQPEVTTQDGVRKLTYSIGSSVDSPLTGPFLFAPLGASAKPSPPYR